MGKTEENAKYYLDLYIDNSYHSGKFGKIRSGCVFNGDWLRIWNDRKNGYMYQFKGGDEKIFTELTFK